MARVVNLESGWLNRQLDSASQKASELPQWLTRSPKRRAPENMARACDEKYCWNKACCGLNTPQGYKFLCSACSRNHLNLRQALAAKQFQNDMMSVNEITTLLDHGMSYKQIKHMVDRFLGWRLPENFNPDGGISFEPKFNVGTPHEMKNEPTGTNLFDAEQATAMVRYMIEGLPKLDEN